MFRPFFLSALLVPVAAVAQTIPSSVFLQEVFPPGTFDRPIAVRNAADGSNRLFVVGRAGVIQIVQNGAVLPTNFLSMAVSTSGERGLLGLAFHPNYDGTTERRFYVSYSANSGSTHNLAEFQTTVGNPNVADTSTRREVMSTPDPFNNHNGGDLHFGPDGFLYWSIGDGGEQNDPNGFAQCLWKKPDDNNSTAAACTPGGGQNYWLLGKILRIDPTQTTASATADMCGATVGQPAGYSIPPGNPFIGSANTCDEIFHYGMRNPYRFSFDRNNGDMYVGDVGQGNWEETTRIPAGQAGVNLGWRCFEGTTTFNTTGSCSPTPTTLMPFQTYSHASNNRCSITGGYRYRGPILALQNTYFSGDYCSGERFFATFDGSVWTPAVGTPTVWTTSTQPLFGFELLGFGEDEQGNLYVLRSSASSANVGGLYVIASMDNLFQSGFE